ncbi:MAG: hypothetical protein O2826_07165, partial [Chloroflexi bacterium]|nr:hypothetical protein [Chloroflexota bacterium]
PVVRGSPCPDARCEAYQKTTRVCMRTPDGIPMTPDRSKNAYAPLSCQYVRHEAPLATHKPGQGEGLDQA